MNQTDHILLKQIKTGNHSAFTILYERYWESLYSFVFTRTRDKEVTEELLQNLWVKVLENTENIQTDIQESAKGYLLRYLHYRIIDYFNSHKKIFDVNIDETEDSMDITDTDYFEILEENKISELFAMIDEIVSQLPITEQKVYDLRIRKNMSVNETAEALDISNKTVSNKLSKTLGEIREKMSGEYQSSKKLVPLLILFDIFTKQ
ncbi:RNA polymerase sigma factor [Chryseobacterium oryctis]|uniref:Sigma-70 family RNA polymerase sigma factor n=1 Tax=Chryseobacterium oryctis TaxID=2952618 RepID=A0ABT3HSI0_9FLAO|nr:sigma-70 family RNA polymerase sigma factor [Chryseobacterium oryctis]MCW3162742.1 sigma-70 family RNA polymerase sigma factor [Chryseobacterium oryctis]